ncbi:uncharacterized protein LOC143151527 isoform X2 [Ptiloglossa arizonensis]|uniref:uncharacterized protein LOC143151527 isoform X2 n=1 Tax=Ptiloglossa arizonensis TaxID=3350558 RepID=UPI003FA0F451
MDEILTLILDDYQIKNFVDWICNDMENCVVAHGRFLKSCMRKFVKENLMELLNLLQLSVLFTVDELTSDILDVIDINWLLPEKVIDVWLIAQELNVKVLQDMSFAICLDRFEELPLHSLVELTKDNIIQLLQNVNVRSSIEYLRLIRNKWIQHHMTSVLPDVKEERQTKFIHCILTREMKLFVNKEPCLCTWNENDFSNSFLLESGCQMFGCQMFGMQVASRGFSIYTIGGEIGALSGNFNYLILCYSLISKKWYYQAVLRFPRRHMVAAFLKNKLTLVGGVGRYRLKLVTVDILDIHTGKWKEGAEVPISFTEVPPYCVMNGKLFIMRTSVYIYDPEVDYWQIISINENSIGHNVHALVTHKTLFYYYGAISKRIDVTGYLLVCEKEECLKQCTEHVKILKMNIVHEDESYQLRYATELNLGIMLLTARSDDKHEYLHLHTQKSINRLKTFMHKSSSFNVIDLDTLYDTV